MLDGGIQTLGYQEESLYGVAVDPGLLLGHDNAQSHVATVPER